MPISTVVTSMKNEAPYIIEWVAYHRALGFDRVVVLANDCTDGTHEMLLRLHEMGVIAYYENEVPTGAKPHSRALKIANLTPEVKSADFVMVLDADEFLVVKKAPHTLDVLIDVMQDRSADMMVIPWRLFGSGHNIEFEDRPVIKRFNQSMDASSLPKVGVKTLFRQADNLRLAIHFPKPLMKGGVPISSPGKASWIDAGGQPLKRETLTWNGGRQAIHRDFAEVAHYMVKSLDEYLLKIFRGDGLMNSNRHGIDYWRKADYNQVSDLVVADNLTGFEQERDRLFADPMLAELHRKSVTARFERLETILANPNVQQLRSILEKSTVGNLDQDDIQRSRDLVSQMSPKVSVEKLIDGDIPHSTLLSIADSGLAGSTEISGRIFKQARSNKAMFWPEQTFGKRPLTNLAEGLKRAQKHGRKATLGVRWFHNYQRAAPKDGWPLDEEILIVLSRDDDQILSGYPTHIAQTKAKYVRKSQHGRPPLRQVLTGAETPAEVETLIAEGKMADPRLRLKRFLEDHPQAIELNLDHPDKISAALRIIETRGPSGPSAAKLLRESLAIDLPDAEAVSPTHSDSKRHTVAKPDTVPSQNTVTRPNTVYAQISDIPSERQVEEAAARSLQIGILTLPMNRNYGGNLQAFALMQVLRDFGHRPVLLNRRPGSKDPGTVPEDLAPDANIPLYADRIGLGKKVQNRIFVEKYMTPISRAFHSSAALSKQFGEYGFDAVIVGSDQVWRPKYARGLLRDFFLGFLDEDDRDTRRIAYAASFGSEKDEYKADEKANAAPLLQLFNAVSVREDSAVDLCRNIFGVEAQHVLDPTLLLSKKDYAALLAESQRSSEGGHLLTYVLDATPDKLDVINRISNALSVEPRTTSGQPFESADPLKDEGGDKSVEAWLASFHNASYVVTDSFHGVAFSIIFNRPFVAYGNAKRGLARFQSLLKAVGLEDRIVVDSDEVDIDSLLRPIDWEAVNGRLDALRAKSFKFLTDALGGQPNGSGGKSGIADAPSKQAPLPLASDVTAMASSAPALGADNHPLNVLCTGCGVCVSESCGTLKMVWTQDGFLEPRATNGKVPAEAVRVCPFNPAPEKLVEDEDALAKICLPHADKSDLRLGRFIGTYVGYSTAFRPTSSSGGVATYVFDQLLRRGEVDHLFVVRKSSDGQYSYRIFDASENIETSSKTRYIPVSMDQLFATIETIEGRIAVSAVSCFVKAIRLKQHYHPELKEKIPFVAGIICGGLKSRFYTDFLAQSAGIEGTYRDAEYRVKNPESLSSDYSFAATDSTGKERRVRMQKLGDMWGTGLFKSRACDFCTDVMTELADISLGDAWLPEYKQDGMGNSVIVTRTPLAEQIIQNGIRSGELEASDVVPNTAARTQNGGFNHKQKAVKFRLLSESLTGSRAVPFVRPRIQSDTSIAEIFVQMMREQSRAKSLRMWRQTGNHQAFLRRMRPTLRRLKAVTTARKHSEEVETAGLEALESPLGKTALSPQVEAIGPMLLWVKKMLRDGRINAEVLRAAHPKLSTFTGRANLTDRN
ncbi:polysaccharide pyruvyl transferase family protein [Paracoccus saliphilus]|uniref:Coenzyme F420-reducing hydrogenase, beta subunit n=1 Tax=Paracoccus saliphilus TaxID=405559 RepID=A0AA46A6H6_9RHOB|nr:polysaccharide pyruvyl transferase family protein [Paracoccus saliphilus]WCR01630.1 polysaccharide pyruvyl transferase family protein [Paracoccus saliphilus]SIS98567.1 Coenzyme F420-reducing hydrogenase, beta subunit [Paracoccus saliphilus]